MELVIPGHYFSTMCIAVESVLYADEVNPQE